MFESEIRFGATSCNCNVVFSKCWSQKLALFYLNNSGISFIVAEYVGRQLHRSGLRHGSRIARCGTGHAEAHVPEVQRRLACSEPSLPRLAD